MSIAPHPTRPGLPVVAVLGASGGIGHAVALALLQRGRFAVRAVTHQPGSVRARDLQRAGAQLIAVEPGDPAALQQAFTHAHGVFAITHFWRHRCPERELSEAMQIAKAAADARVAHLVWSTAEDTRRWVRLDDPLLPTRHGRWKVPASDAKGAANQRFRDLGVPCTFLYTATPWEHLLERALQPESGGGLRLTLPAAGACWPGIGLADVGHAVAAILERGSWTVGRSIGIAGEHLPGDVLAAALAATLGLPVRLATPSLDELARSGPPDADDLVALLRFRQLFDAEFSARRSVAEARALHPGLLGFEAWLNSSAGATTAAALHERRAA